MAKELPYFKFEPSEWEAGNIQAASRESKGLFIDICSLYWLRLGELPYALALQKLCNGNNLHMQELCDLEIIGVKDSQIIIEFLDEQLDEFQKTSEKRAKAANKRWNNANAMQVDMNSNAIREEKIREENNKNKKGVNFPDVLKEKREPIKYSEVQNQTAIEVCTYLNVPHPESGAGSTEGFRYIRQFIVNIEAMGKLSYFVDQFKFYKMAWDATNLKKHSYKNFIGTYPDYSDGAWCSKDWKKEAKGNKPESPKAHTVEDLHKIFGG